MDSVSTAHISVPQSINPRLQTCIDRVHLLSQLFPKTGCSCILFIINRLAARSDSYGGMAVAELNANFTCRLRVRQRLLIQARWGPPDYLLVAMLRRAAIRSSRGGCVLKRPVKTPPVESGFTMNSAEVAGETSMGMRLL